MKLKKTFIINILIFTVLFYSLLNHYTSLLMQKIEFSASYGYIDYQNCYSIDNGLIGKFESDQDFINWLKEQFSSFILIKKSGINYGVYTHNDEWIMPIANGTVFNLQQNESFDVFYISNNELDGTKIGKPLTKEKYNFVNLLSLSNTFSKYNSISLSEYFINKKISNTVESSYFHKINFEEQPINNLYNTLYTVAFLICLLQMFLVNHNDHNVEISIRKLCGHDDIEIVIKMIISLVYQLVLASIFGIITFLLTNPEVIFMEIFRNELVAYILYTFKMILPLYIICSITVVITVIKATPLKLLRRME